MAVEDRGPQVAAVGILFLTLAWIFTTLRCFVRISVIRLFRMDDWLAVATLVRVIYSCSEFEELIIRQAIYTVYCTFVLAGARYGTGRHLVDVPQQDVVIAMKVLSPCVVVVG
jgi:hypothetical protein